MALLDEASKLFVEGYSWNLPDEAKSGPADSTPTTAAKKPSQNAAYRWNTHGKLRYAHTLDMAIGQHEYPLPDGGWLRWDTKNGLKRFNAQGNSGCLPCTPTPSCDDQDPCTTDTCDPAQGDCVYQPISGCTKAKGTCMRDSDCDDAEPCTLDQCNKTTGACSHTDQTLCDTGNPCMAQQDNVQMPYCDAKPIPGGNFTFTAANGTCPSLGPGKCIAGVCTPPSKTSDPELGPTDGWVSGLSGERPDVFELAGGELLIADGWYAERFQYNGVRRYKRELPSKIAAAAASPDGGLVALLWQPPESAVPGKSRLVRLSPTGHIVQDVLIDTGLSEFFANDPWQQRGRYLLSRPGGGYSLAATLGWPGVSWKGRIIELGADLTLKMAPKDVTLTGLPATETALNGTPVLGPEQALARDIDAMWPASDGGVLLGWHYTAGGKQVWGAARLGPQGQVLYNKPLTTGPQFRGAFDPLRPQARLAFGPPVDYPPVGQFQITEDGPQVVGSPKAQMMSYNLTGKERWRVAAWSQLPGGRSLGSQVNLGSSSDLLSWSFATKSMATLQPYNEPAKCCNNGAYDYSAVDAGWTTWLHATCASGTLAVDSTTTVAPGAVMAAWDKQASTCGAAMCSVVSQWGVEPFDNSYGFAPEDILPLVLDNDQHVIRQIYALSDGRIAVIATGTPYEPRKTVLIVLDQWNRFRRCGPYGSDVHLIYSNPPPPLTSNNAFYFPEACQAAYF